MVSSVAVYRLACLWLELSLTFDSYQCCSHGVWLIINVFNCRQIPRVKTGRSNKILHHAHNTFILSYTWFILYVHVDTSVSGDLSNLTFLSRQTIAILASIMAKRSPTQLRGPQPNGMWDIGWWLAFSSGWNLCTRRVMVYINRYTWTHTNTHIHTQLIRHMHTCN